jgi:hypothetical protein
MKMYLVLHHWQMRKLLNVIFVVKISKIKQILRNTKTHTLEGNVLNTVAHALKLFVTTLKKRHSNVKYVAKDILTEVIWQHITVCIQKRRS